MLKEENYLPAGLLDTSTPSPCMSVLEEVSLVLVTQSDNPRIDMQRMIAEYRNLTDAGILRNTKVKECRSALEVQKKKNLDVLTKYCTRKGMKPDPETFTCRL